MSYPPDDGVWSSFGPAMDEARQEQKQDELVFVAFAELVCGRPARANELLQQLRADRLQLVAKSAADLTTLIEQISEKRAQQNP